MKRWLLLLFICIGLMKSKAQEYNSFADNEGITSINDSENKFSQNKKTKTLLYSTTGTITLGTLSTPVNICIGNTISIVANVLNTTGTCGNGTFNYDWYYNTTNSVTGATLKKSYSAQTITNTFNSITTSTSSDAGWYYVIVSSSDGGCGVSGTSGFVQVNINQLPTPTISGLTTVCAGSLITLSGVPTVASGSSFNAANLANYSWSSSAMSVATVSSGVSTAVTVTGVGAGTTSITYTVTDNFGCNGSATYSETVNAQPKLTTATAAAAICSQTPATINLMGLTASSTFSIDYKFGAGIQQTATSVLSNAGNNASLTTINVPSNGTNNQYLNFVKITNSVTLCYNNAISPGYAVITVKRSPQPAIIGGSIVCVSGTLSLTGSPNLKSGSSVSSYLWSSSNLSAATINSSTGFLTGVSTGSTIISFYVKDNNSCDSTATQTETVITAPNVSIAGNSSVCVGSSTVLSASSSTGTAPYSYSWLSATPAAATITPPSGISITVTGQASGSSNIIATVTDNNGCTASSPATVTVKVRPVVSISNKIDDVCMTKNGSIKLTVTNGSPGYNITWTNVSAQSGTINTAGGSLMASGLPAGNIAFFVTDANGCTIISQ